MDTLASFKGAHDTFARVLQGVRTEQLDDPATGMDWRVRDLPAHVTSVTQHIGGVRIASSGEDLMDMHAAVAAAATVEVVIGAHAEAARAACEAFAAPDGLTRLYELTWWMMSFSGQQIAPILAMDCYTHAWDLARSTGQPTDFDEVLANEMLVIARSSIPAGGRSTVSFRGTVTFADEQPCDPSRPAVDQLAAYLGRVVD
jgi:uncharacterized protein (TIGR03086 family)